MKEHGSSMEIQREVNNFQTPSGQPVQVHGQGYPVESKTQDFSHTSMPKQSQVPGTSNTQVCEPSRLLNSSNESQLSNMQRVCNQPVLATEQVRSSAYTIEKIPLGRLLPIILPKLDKDTATQLDDLYGKLRRNEIAKEQFVRLMKSCVGDQMLRLAVVKMQAKMPSQSPGQKPHVRPPTGTAAQISDPYSFGQLHQKNHSTPTVTQPVKDLGHQTIDSHSKQAMSSVKQDPSEKSLEKQPKPQISSQVLTFSGTVLVDQGESLPVPSTDELLDIHNSYDSRIDYPSSMRTATVETSGSVSSHDNTDFQVESQGISATPMSGIGSNSKASAKQPYSGQKKALDALDSLPPLPSKKQKVSGAFSDSIEHLRDIAAVSGVSLMEEEEQLFSGPKDDSRVLEASHKAVQEEEDRLFLQKNPLQKKLAEIMTKCGLKNLSNDVERCLSLCVEERLRALISNLIRVSKQRADSEKSRHATVVTSDVREQILAINRKAIKEWDKKRAEAEKLRKQNEPDSSAVVDADKEKDEGRAKSLKMPVNKEEEDKLTMAANVAARAAVGGDDLLSKWQIMAKTPQKREGGPQIATSSQVGNDATIKQLTTSLAKVQETRGNEKRDPSAALSASGVVRQGSISQIAVPPPRVAPRISVKDVIAVLEREPQMAKSTMIYRLRNRMYGDPATE